MWSEGFAFRQLKWGGRFKQMLARIREHCANTIYLRDCQVYGSDMNIFIRTGRITIHIVARAHEDHIEVNTSTQFRSYDDGHTWIDIRGRPMIMRIMVDEIIAGRLCVSEDTAREIAKLIGEYAIAIKWCGDGQWGRSYRFAIYIMPPGHKNRVAVMRFTESQIFVDNMSYRYNYYDGIDLITKSISDQIEELITAREYLRATYPDMAAFDYPTNDIQLDPGVSMDFLYGEINELAATLGAVSAVLPQPIAEEIVAELQ